MPSQQELHTIQIKSLNNHKRNVRQKSHHTDIRPARQKFTSQVQIFTSLDNDITETRQGVSIKK